MLAACFWPFELNPRNEVEWLKEKNGIRFSGRGQALSRDLFPAIPQPSGDASLTIEVAIRPLKLDGRRLPHILSFITGTGQPVFGLGAWRSLLGVQVGRPEADQGHQKAARIWSGDVLTLGRPVFVTVVARQQGTSLYLDSRHQGDYPEASLPAGAIPPSRLLLGNSPTGRNGWKGDILAVAVYKRALTRDEVAQNHTAWVDGKLPGPAAREALLARYDFAAGSSVVASGEYGIRNDLLIPAVFKPLRRSVLNGPPRDAKSTEIFNLDGFLNILGFMPFGWLALSALGSAPLLPDRLQSLIVVFSGFALSLAIELTQVFLPARSSSLTDLGANTIGTAAGVLLFFIYNTTANLVAQLARQQNTFRCKGRDLTKREPFPSD